MYRNYSYLIIMLLIYLLVPNEVVNALSLKDLQNDKINILVVYTNEQNEKSTGVNELSLLLHHFTNDVIVVSDEALTKEHLEQTTHLFYYGEHKKTLNENVVSHLNRFDGPFIAIGKNKKHFSKLNKIEMDGKVKIDRISAQNNEQVFLLNEPILVERLNKHDDLNVLMHGYKGEKEYPLFVKHEQVYYVTSTILNDPNMINYLSKLLHTILPNKHEHKHTAFLKLEGIHPQTDPEQLLEIGTFLNRQQIPYLLVINPFYTVPGQVEPISLSQSPELIKTLQQLQQKGGTIIVDGDQYIEAYRESYLHQEHDTIETKVQELLYQFLLYDLYPLSFNMTNEKNLIENNILLTNYFLSLFGDNLLKHNHFDSLYFAPFMTTSELFQNVTLFPSLIKYPYDNEQYDSQVITKKIEQALIVPDSMIGVSYELSCGIERLDELLNELLLISNLDWLDLKQTEQFVHLQDITVTSNKTGKLHIAYDREHAELMVNKQNKKELTLLEKILWSITLLVFLFVTLFILITLYLRTQLKKRLFKERIEDG